MHQIGSTARVHCTHLANISENKIITTLFKIRKKNFHNINHDNIAGNIFVWELREKKTINKECS